MLFIILCSRNYTICTANMWYVSAHIHICTYSIKAISTPHGACARMSVTVKLCCRLTQWIFLHCSSADKLLGSARDWEPGIYELMALVWAVVWRLWCALWRVDSRCWLDHLAHLHVHKQYYVYQRLHTWHCMLATTTSAYAFIPCL